MKKNSSKNRIGIMSVVHQGKKPFGLQTYFFEDMVRSVDLADSDFFFFSPLDWRAHQKEVHGYNFVDGEWLDTKSKIPAIIYDRAFSKDEDQKLHIEKVREFLGASNRLILNPLELADLLNDKVRFHSFLLEKDIPTLTAFPFSALESTNVFGSFHSDAIYIKPTFGSKGEGIFAVEKRDDKYALKDHLGHSIHANTLSKLLEHLNSKIEDKSRYFVQEEARIELYNEAPFDIRVLVQNYGDDYVVTGKAMRIGRKNAITSNLNSGGNAIPLEEAELFFEEKYMYSLKDLHQMVESICLGCTEELRKEVGDFCEIGFDVLITKDRGPIILEANAKPSRWVFVKMADYLKSIGKEDSYYLDRRKETVSVPMKYASYLLAKIY